MDICIIIYSDYKLLTVYMLHYLIMACYNEVHVCIMFYYNVGLNSKYQSFRSCILYNLIIDEVI